MITAKVEYYDGKFMVQLSKDGFYIDNMKHCETAEEVYEYMWQNKVVSFGILTMETAKRMAEAM